MVRFWIGTSGWHYFHWRGPFYPQELPPWKWLGYYVQHFPTVELNASFYRQPRRQTWQDWRKATPDGFRFAVKASRFITHIKRLKEPEEPLQTFLASVTLLAEKLGPILYQLPPGFHHTAENIERLAEFLDLLPRNLRHTFEFRHKSWFCDDVYSLLQRHSVAFCSFDMARLPCPLLVTADFAYVRFHGPEARYASNYPDELLQDWARRIRQMAHDLTDVYIYFNNDFGGYAVANAKTLASLLGAG